MTADPRTDVTRWFDWPAILRGVLAAVVIVLLAEWDGRPAGLLGAVTGWLCAGLYLAGRNRERRERRTALSAPLAGQHTTEKETDRG